MEFEEFGFGNKDGFCPHCGEDYKQRELERLITYGEYTEFECRSCKNWVRGFCEFEFMGPDLEYYLIAIRPLDDSQ